MTQSEYFISFRDLDDQVVCVNCRHIVMVICPSLLSKEPNGTVHIIGGYAKISITTAKKIQEQIVALNIDRTEVVN